MRRGNKGLLTILGLILLALAVFQLGWWYADSGTFSVEFRNELYPNGLVEICFSRGRDYYRNRWFGISGYRYLQTNTREAMAIHQSAWYVGSATGALEKALRHQLVEQVGLVDPRVTVKLLRHRRARVTAVAQVSATDQIDPLAQQASQVIDAYLQHQLDLTAVKPVVRLSPVDRRWHVSVV
ncbi:alkaline shock response membrane anchor protein AmaP [Levilactobacillus brevis]|nr:alkaline shock response membrane anchor protein AmaP [Levilactobacillus brevis]